MSYTREAKEGRREEGRREERAESERKEEKGKREKDREREEAAAKRRENAKKAPKPMDFQVIRRVAEDRSFRRSTVLESGNPARFDICRQLFI